MLRRLLGAGPRGRAPLLVPLAVAVLSAVDLPSQNPRGRGRRNAPVVAIHAGTVHPISGPAIEDGVVLMRGSRILAVGPSDAVEVPPDATVLEYPDGHVYPGLVDALSVAFLGDAANDGNLDAGTAVATALDAFDEESGELVESGVTTAYVSNRSGATWRGEGALIRLRPGGFEVFPEHATAGVHLRMTTGPGPGHPLQRMKQLQAFGQEFDQLEAYEKAFEDRKEKLEEYQKKFEEYLEWHRKKSAEKGEGEAGEEEKPATERPPAEAGEGRGGEGRGGERRGGRRGSRGGPPPGGTPPGENTQGRGGRGGPPGGGPQGRPQEAATGSEDKAPERPKFPPEPKRDQAKEALIKVRDGELALFVEAHRPEELARAIEVAREHELRQVVLELATGGAAAVEKIASAGLPVVLDTALPPSVSGRVPAGANYVDEALEHASVAARLAAAGVPFALGSGSVERARHLPSLVAEAIGQGVDPDVAIEAVTLTPARILGIADRVGSLEPRKLADIVVTSAPLESSEARVLRVISAGTTVHEAR